MLAMVGCYHFQKLPNVPLDDIVDLSPHIIGIPAPTPPPTTPPGLSGSATDFF